MLIFIWQLLPKSYVPWHLPYINGLASILTTSNLAVTKKLAKGAVATTTPVLCTVRFFSTGSASHHFVTINNHILFLLCDFCSMSYRIFIQIRSTAFWTVLAYSTIQCMEYSGYEPIQLETTLQCSVVFNWPRSYPKWSVGWIHEIYSQIFVNVTVALGCKMVAPIPVT